MGFFDFHCFSNWKCVGDPLRSAWKKPHEVPLRSAWKQPRQLMRLLNFHCFSDWGLISCSFDGERFALSAFRNKGQTASPVFRKWRQRGLWKLAATASPAVSRTPLDPPRSPISSCLPPPSWTPLAPQFQCCLDLCWALAKYFPLLTPSFLLGVKFFQHWDWGARGGND